MRRWKTAAWMLAAAAMLPGCAPYMSSCSWVVPEAGNSIEVVGPDLLPLSPHTVDGYASRFDYWVRIEDGDGEEVAKPEHITITVMDDAGRVLGTEEINLRVVRRRDVAIETI